MKKEYDRWVVQIRDGYEKDGKWVTYGQTHYYADSAQREFVTGFYDEQHGKGLVRCKRCRIEVEP